LPEKQQVFTSEKSNGRLKEESRKRHRANQQSIAPKKKE